MIKLPFSKKKARSPHQKYPEAYHKSIYFSKDTYSAIEMIAAEEKISVKKAADILVRRGILLYMTESKNNMRRNKY